MSWFDTLKGYRANYNPGYYGSIPQFYHFLTRAFRPASQQTPQYLQKRLGWDEVSDGEKLEIKDHFYTMDDERKQQDDENFAGWRSNWIPGISVDFSDIDNPIVDEHMFEKWRKATQTKGEDVSGYHNSTWTQRMTYKKMESTLMRR